MRKICMVLLVAVLVTAVFVNIGCRRESAAAGRTETLIVGLAGMPANLDPALTNGHKYGSYQYCKQQYHANLFHFFLHIKMFFTNSFISQNCYLCK